MKCRHPNGSGCVEEDDCTRSICAAPLTAYPEEDQKFYNFWYRHMNGDVMQPPLAFVSHSVARYIWDEARKK